MVRTFDTVHGIEDPPQKEEQQPFPQDKDLRLEEVKPVTNKKAWTISIAASILLVAGVFAALFGAGFHLYIVKTPSMGTTAPVGTLVAVHAQDSYTIGDVVSYARSGRVYTHRIVDITAQGFITQGDINGSPDALPVTQSQIVGAVTFYAKYLGFLVEGLPWLIIGASIVYGLSLMPRVGRAWRWHFRLIGWSLVVSLVALWFRPWVNMEMINYVAQADGVDMHLVNTGIFPVSVLGKVLASGQDAVVTQTVVDITGHYSVTPQLVLNSGYFLMLLAFCLTPVLVSLFIGVEYEVTDSIVEPVVATKRFKPQYRRIGQVAFTVTASVIVVALVLQLNTNAAFAASIKNTADKVGTRTWFSCEAAEVGTGNARFVWSLSSAGTQPNLDGSGHTGTILGSWRSVSNSSPCPNDSPKTSLTFDGSTCITDRTAVTGNDTYSLEIWFNTTTRANGKLIGFGNNQQVSDTKWDRHIYMDASGRVLFGAWPYDQKVVSSPAGTNYADGQWHHVMATSSSSGVISLYLDGNLVGSRSDAAGQESYSGYWKVGCGNLSSWQDANGTWQYNWPNYYTGLLRFAAVYNNTLTAAQAKEHYQAGIA